MQMAEFAYSQLMQDLAGLLERDGVVLGALPMGKRSCCARAEGGVVGKALYGREQAFSAEQPDEPGHSGRGEPMLGEPLTLKHVKPFVVGHWGNTPRQNFIYVHLNRVIKKFDLDMF